MSGERMTTRAEADHMSAAIMAVVDSLERHGYARGQIGVAMAGMALGIVAAHDGVGAARRVVDAVSRALQQEGSR